MNENRVTEGRHVLPLSGTSEITYGSLTVEVTASVRLLFAASLTLYCLSLFSKIILTLFSLVTITVMTISSSVSSSWLFLSYQRY